MSRITLQKSLGAPFLLPLGELELGSTANEREFELGAPRLRTLWTVDSVAVECSLLFKNPIAGTEPVLQLELLLLISNIPTAVNIIQTKVPNPNKQITRHLYVLEPFRDLTSVRSEPITLRFRITNELGESPVQISNKSVQVSQPLVIANIDQEFVGSAN